MTFDICSKFVGPVPVDIFFQQFVPEAPVPRPQGDLLFSETTVRKNEDGFIEAIRASGLCPNLRFENTVSRPRKEYIPLKPHILVYSSVPSQQPEECHPGTVELWIESKPKKKDPFRQIEAVQKQRKEKAFRHGWSIRAYKTCDLLIAYAASLHRSQFRVFSFSVVLFEDTARLLRWDRSGAIYTESFKWTDGGLSEFLWRFNHLSAVDRGYDATVSSADDDEATAALPILRTHPKFENVRKEDLHRILVWDDRASDDGPRRYITPGPKWASGSLFGRATFGYVAYDTWNGNLVYLKDFWRVDHPTVRKEGDVYRELHEAEVPNIAKLGRAGDVCLTVQDGQSLDSASVQRTETQKYLNESWCPGRPRVEPYIHYRLVLETVGKPLNRCKSTRQLCEVIRDAVVAHTAAYNKARILHQDISAGNILITEEGTGILIDWDLSTKVKEYVDADAESKRHSRTGTWQFISIARLLDPWSRPHEVSDDLESFFWVLMYQVVRHRNTVRDLKNAIQDIFDYRSEPDSKGIVKGGDGKLACVSNCRLSSVIIEGIVETPCCEIIEEMRSLFQDFYRMEDASLTGSARVRIEEKRKRDPRINVAREKLRTSDAFLAIFERHLGIEWDINDDGSLDLTAGQRGQTASRNRRKRKADESDIEANIHVWRIGRMPPPDERSVDEHSHSSQTTSTSYRESPFSTSSTILSSGPDPSGSLGSRDNGPREDQ